MKKVTRVLRDNSQNILSEWERLVLIHVEATRKSNKIALYDHIPNILEDIIDILQRHDVMDWDLEDPKMDKIETNSVEHGRHRASSADFTADQILHEYMIFHNVIIRILNKNNITDNNVLHLLKCCIDTAMLKSTQAFAKSIREMQSKLVGTLAHDIRNPLAAARLGIEMFSLRTGAEHVAKVQKMTMKSVDKALEMIEGLLDSITVSAGEGMMLVFTESNIYPDIQTIYEEACTVHSEEIILECKDKKLNGIFDATAIRRALENLITNAVKYGDSKRPITVKVEKESDEFLNLSVHNYGPSIPKEKQKDIFSFLKLGESKPNRKLQSWGIGLTLVKMVAEAHGGKVTLESSEEHGTEFNLNISRTVNEPGKQRTKLNLN